MSKLPVTALQQQTLLRDLRVQMSGKSNSAVCKSRCEAKHFIPSSEQDSNQA